MSAPSASWCPLGADVAAGHRPPTACFRSPVPSAKAKCSARARAEIDGMALAGGCFVCGCRMDAWERADRGFACPKCAEQIRYLCSGVCALCRGDFCPSRCAAGQHGCAAAAAAAARPGRRPPAAFCGSGRLRRRRGPVAWLLSDGRQCRRGRGWRLASVGGAAGRWGLAGTFCSRCWDGLPVPSRVGRVFGCWVCGRLARWPQTASAAVS